VLLRRTEAEGSGRRHDRSRARDAPHISSVTVVAGAVVRGKLIELHKTCGLVLDFPDDAESGKTRERAQEAMTKVSMSVQELGLSLRKGVFE